MEEAAIAALERAGFAAWPANATHNIAGWAVRVAGGGSKRANSANPLPGAAAADVVLPSVEAIYRAAQLPAIFRLTPLAPRGAEAALAAAGYGMAQPSWVMTREAGAAAAVEGLRIETAPSAAWLSGVAALDDAKAGPEHEFIAGAIRLPAAFATLVEDGSAVGFGLAVADGGFVGLFDIVIAPRRRGRGLGGRLTRGLMAWGRQQGATAAWLQVRDGNQAARALYRNLGFVDAYPYHYRVKRAAWAITALE